MEISDVESGLSIRDFGENDDIIEETESNGDDIERPMTAVPVLTKDKLVSFLKLKRLKNSMTTLLPRTVSHSTKPSFRPKTNNQSLKKFF